MPVVIVKIVFSAKKGSLAYSSTGEECSEKVVLFHVSFLQESGYGLR